MKKLEEQGSSPKDDAPVELGRGSSLGRYLIVGLVGRGGMGEVYSAYDPELDRKIALKLLRAHSTAGADPSEGRARLLREAQAIARLSDPNVVVVYDVGTFEDRVFLAMEFVDGNTLGYWLEAKAHAWRETVDIFAAAGSGLAAAHRAGIVHRDFKPDNVMIGRDGKVRVMDFGLARTVAADASDAGQPDGAVPTVERRTSGARAIAINSAVSVGDTTSEPVSPAPVAVSAPALWTEDDTSTRDLSQVAEPMASDAAASLFKSPLTVTGAMMGTPAYMAPEQFRGGPVDARTDQFSFCCALYEGLYGERPFAGKTLQELSANVVAGRVCPAPGKARVPNWLRKVLLRGLRVQRADRHASMEVLLAALARDPARSRRRWAAAGSVAALIGVLAVGLVQSRREQRMRCLGAETRLAGIWELPNGKGLSPKKEAVRRAFMATGKRYAADSFTVVMNTLDRYVGEWNDMHRDACEATNMRGEQSAEVLDLRMGCLHERLSEVRSLVSVFSDANAEVVSKSVEAAQSLRAIQQCADITSLRAVVRPPDDPVVRRAVADVRTRLADIKALADAGQYKAALKAIGPALGTAREINYPPAVAEALARLGRLQAITGDNAGAAKNYEDAVWIAEAARHDEVAAEAAAQLIEIAGSEGGAQVEGERWARHAGAVLRRLGPGHDILAGWRSNNLGLLYLREGRPQDALESFREALRLKVSSLGEENLDVAITMGNIANVLGQLDRADDAMETNDKALQIFARTVGMENPYYAGSLSNAAEFGNARSKYREAAAMAERALAIYEREFGPEHAVLGFPLTALGISLVGQGQDTSAVSYLRRALAIRERIQAEPALLGETQFALARALPSNDQSLEVARSLALKARANWGTSTACASKCPGIDAWISAHLVRGSRISMR